MRNDTFKVRFGCDNCGHSDLYDIPVRRIIENYDYEDRSPSSYHRLNDESETILPCAHCKLPHLLVAAYTEEEAAHAK